VRSESDEAAEAGTFCQDARRSARFIDGRIRGIVGGGGEDKNHHSPGKKHGGMVFFIDFFVKGITTQKYSVGTQQAPCSRASAFTFKLRETTWFWKQF
jgi:hypothetical protein